MSGQLLASDVIQVPVSSAVFRAGILSSGTSLCSGQRHCLCKQQFFKCAVELEQACHGRAVMSQVQAAMRSKLKYESAAEVPERVVYIIFQHLLLTNMQAAQRTKLDKLERKQRRLPKRIGTMPLILEMVPAGMKL